MDNNYSTKAQVNCLFSKLIRKHLRCRYASRLLTINVTFFAIRLTNSLQIVVEVDYGKVYPLLITEPEYVISQILSNYAKKCSCDCKTILPPCKLKFSA